MTSLWRRPRRWAEWRLRGSCAVRDAGLRRAFLEDPENTVLVSHPRTGSHLLRMTAELYFGRPTLPRTFYHPWREDYLLLHTHDGDLSFEHPTILYLHREAVATVYSELRYRNGDEADRALVEEITLSYGRHLRKWLLDEDFTRRKTVLTYETLVGEPLDAVARLCEHFEETMERGRARRALGRVTHAEVARRTGHDPRVVRSPQDREAYRKRGEAFRQRYGARVRELLRELDSRLASRAGTGEATRDGA